MSKSDVERVSGYKLRLWYEGTAREYTCNISTTWINNVRITFNSKTIKGSFSFYGDKLHSISFAAENGGEKVFCKAMLVEFGEGKPKYGGERYLWYDNTTEMEMGNEGWCVLRAW
ncbi:hypothetical protein ACFL1N_14215, partial [Thermodesulfobacteriota bacterium]